MKRILTLIFLLSVATMRAMAQDKAPDFLKEGDKVAIISPSYHLKDTVKLARAMDVLRSWGLEPVKAPNLNTPSPLEEGLTPDRKKNYYGGSTLERTADLLWALNDPEIKAIICERGGYGAIHLLNMIPRRAWTDNPKWLVGYSDITTLHAMANASGAQTIHGNMCGDLGRTEGPDEASEALRELLFGKMPEYHLDSCEFNNQGKAKGILVGGNMITFAALAGTYADIMDNEGCIIFIEEIEESMHAIDRLFNMLLISGKMSNVKGLIFGDFTDCGKDLPYESVYEMLYQYTKDLDIPVCFGFPGGHGKLNYPLVFGRKVKLKVTKDGATISY